MAMISPRYVLALGLSCILFGCSSKPVQVVEEPDDPAQILAASKGGPFTSAEVRLTNSLQQFLGDYLTVGVRNPKWDSAATNALYHLAVSRVSAPDDWRQTAWRSAKEAIAAGCTDPLVTYTWVWLNYGDPSPGSPMTAEAYTQAAEGLLASQYSTLRKFWAALKAAQAQQAITNITPPIVHQYRRAAADLAEIMVVDTSLPAEEVLTAVKSLMETVYHNHIQLPEFYSRLKPSLEHYWGDYAETWQIIGNAQVGMAWLERGSDYAHTVTPERWKAFAEHLAGAETALNRSWSIKPMEATTLSMLSLEHGQGRGRERMEKFFNRAMLMNPNSYDACAHKLLYLYPRWYGSTDALLDFGWECVNSTNWGGQVPLMMLRAHEEIAFTKYQDEEERKKYWRDPEVWDGVHSAFKKFFQLNPDARGWHHDYLRYAYLCRAWDVFHEQLPLLGPINYSFFGGKEKFEAMVAEANLHKRTGT